MRKAVAALQRRNAAAAPAVIAASIKSKLPPQRHHWNRVPAPRSFAPSAMQQVSARKWREKVWAALCETAPCAAPGPSALRREHIQAAAMIPSARIRERLADVIGAICAGMVPRDDHFVTGSTLSPVPKKEPGDFRPIGVGEILRRTAARIGLKLLLDQVGPTLHDKRQFGASRDGGHNVYQTIRRCAADGQFVVGIDLANAFCTVDRDRVLDTVRDLHDIRPLVEGLYGNDANMALRATGETIVSDRGVVQGCPLAALLFAMTIQPAIDEARSQLAATGLSVTDVWYADDGTAASHSAPALDIFLRYLGAAMANRGLTLSSKKAHFIAPADLEDDHIDVKLLATHAVRVPLIVCVGLPVCPRGQPDAETLIAHHFDEVVAGATDVVTTLKRLEHPQHIVQALALAGTWSRLQYYVRGYAGLLPTDALHRAELTDIDTLRAACGEHADSVDIPQWLVASLPLRDGGLGIHSVTAEAAIHAALRPSIAHDAPGACPPPPTKGALTAARDHVSITTADILRKSWSPAKMAALMDASSPAARAWLSAPLSRADNTLVTDPRTAATMIAHAIGCDILPAGYPCLRRGESCRPSQSPLCDPAGQHVTNCAYLFTRRHHAIRNTLLCELAEHAPHVSPMIEQGCRQDGEPYDPPHDADRVGDVVLRDHASASWMFIDVVVGGLAQHLMAKATRKRGVYPNEQHEKKMRDRRRTVVLAAKQQHVILAFGPSGSPSYHTDQFLRTLARIIDPAQHGSIGTGRGAYTTAQRLLAKCQVAILQTTAHRAVELADELHATDPRHCNAGTARAAAAATAKAVSDIREQLFNSHNRATRSRLGAAQALREPASAPGASGSALHGISPPNQPRDPHRRPSTDTNSTVHRGRSPADGWLDDERAHAPRPPGDAPMGASAAGASAAEQATRGSGPARGAPATAATAANEIGRSPCRAVGPNPCAVTRTDSVIGPRPAHDLGPRPRPIALRIARQSRLEQSVPIARRKPSHHGDVMRAGQNFHDGFGGQQPPHAGASAADAAAAGNALGPCQDHPPRAGASAAGASAADSALGRCPANDHDPCPCPIATDLARASRRTQSAPIDRRVSSPNGGVPEDTAQREYVRRKTANDDRPPPTTGTHDAARPVYVRAHTRTFTDPKTGLPSHRIYPAHWRTARGRAQSSIPISVEPLPQRDSSYSSHTSNGHRGETEPRREGSSSRSSSDDSAK